jgi:PAS domain S-box-containing protein
LRFGLRVLVLALLLAGVVPPTVVLVYEAQANMANVREIARSAVVANARLVAQQHQRAVDTARGTLLAIARLPAVRTFDSAACVAALGAIGAATDLWANLGAVRPDGSMYCSAFPMPGSVNHSDRAFFQGALRTGDVAAGTHVISKVRGIGAFGFGYPVRDDAGAVIAVTFASLRTDSLQRQLELLPIGERVRVTVLDRVGTIVTSRPRAEDGQLSPFDLAIAKMAMAGGIIHEAVAPDGVSRVYGFAPVEAVDGPAMFVIAAMPTEVVEEPVRALARRTLWVWAMAIVAVVLGTGFIAEYVLIRRFRALSRAAAGIATGDYAARTGLRAGRDELGHLVGAFDEMAASLEGLQKQNRLLLDSIGDGIVGLDREMRVVFANPAAGAIFRLPPEEMKGKVFGALLQDGGTHSDPCLVRESMADGHVHQASDDSFTRLDGAAVPVEFVTTPIVDAKEIVGAVVALRDVTERRRLEDQLRQAQKMEAVGQLAGGVAHDFNNLLTAIITCARMVQESLAPNHPAQSDVSEILASGDRAAQLTRQLLAFARRQRLAPRAMDLRESVGGMERMLRRVLGENIELHVELAPAPVIVHADPGQLELVVLNLAVNARDAMPSGGRLTIAVDVVDPADVAPVEGELLPDGPLGRITVSDTGAGMDGATQERIFEPFFTTKPSGKGTGLGLATVYGIVKQSDGAIRLRSAPGQGTEFRVLLPLRAGEAALAQREPAQAVGGTERVLVLEDDDVLRTLVCRALASGGYTVLEASRPSVAVARLAANEVDLLVTDLILPEESGWSLYRRLAAQRPTLRVLIMSGFAATPDPSLSTLPADVPFLPKPFAPHDLLVKARQALDGPPPSPPPGPPGERAG